MRIKRKKFLKIFIKLTSAVVLLVVLSLTALFLSVHWGAFGDLPKKSELSGIQNEEASLVFSSDGVLIGKYFAENRTNIKHEEIPEHLKNALIATEDKRFFSHSGYDTQSYFRVFFKSILLGDRSGGGGSTLTQQLIKNLYGRGHHGFLTMPVNKLKEIIIATRMEEVYSKEELLLLYLNSVPFGEDVYGVESAARRFFNKPAKQLHVQESAVLVGMLKANTYFNPKLNPENSLLRRNVVLNQMKKVDYLTIGETDSLKQLPLGLNYENLNLSAPAGYFVHQVKGQVLELLDSINASTGKEYDTEKDGLKIHTTLNMKIQEFSINAIKKHLMQMQKQLDVELKKYGFRKRWYKEQTKELGDKYLQSRNIELLEWEGFTTKNISKLDSLWHYYKMLNASVLITNPKNGNVLTWVGGNHYRMLPFDMVLSHRQIASAFKPILYATALETGISPCHYLKNKEKEYPEYKNWQPKNANLKSTPDSAVAMWYALAQSMNLPSVELFFETGKENIIKSCENLRFPEVTNQTPSLALGTLDLSLYEIVKAYSAFSNKGKMNELVMIEKITDANGNIIYETSQEEPEEVFSTETSKKITAMLQQVIEQGTGRKIRNKYGIKAELAGKTGSAQNYSNAWFIAYTPDIVLGTWVGASTPDIHFYSSKGSGSSLALPIVAGILQEIEKNSKLKESYLRPFELPTELYSFLDCAPYRQKGIKGFFNRLFSKKEKKNNNFKDSSNKEKSKKKKKSIFKKIFKKK